MWDKETPLQLLSTMPNVLEDMHLEKLQMLLEADKYKNQLVSGLDLCGTYAPFCDGCNKENKYPCATSYINYLKEEGIDIQIGAGAPQEETENLAEEDVASEEPENTPAEPENVQEVVEEVVEEVKPEEESNSTEEEPKKIKIRIAVARKKTTL